MPAKSLFSQSYVSSGNAMVGLKVTSSRRAYATPRSAAGTAALGVGIAYVLLEEITVDPTMELPELA